MTPITKTSYVDNFDSEKEGYVEVGYRKKKAFIKQGTLEVVNPDNIPLNLQAMAMGVVIADEHNCWEKTPFGNTHRTFHKPMNMQQAKEYLKKLN